MPNLRKRRTKKSSTKGWVFIFFSIFIIAFIGFYFYDLNKLHFDRSSETMCRKDGVVSRETAIVIDATDSFSETQALLIKKEISMMLIDSIVDGRFTLYVLKENIDNTSLLFTACNPGDGKNSNELTSNPRKIKKNWTDNFYNKFVLSIDKLIGDYVSNQSPIMEMIKYISIKTLYDSSAYQKKLIIVSDMLQHTELFSQYKSKKNIEDFKKSPYFLQLKPHLTNVDVEILYILRFQNMNLQNRGHIDFWESFISDSGGQVIRVKSIN